MPFALYSLYSAFIPARVALVKPRSAPTRKSSEPVCAAHPTSNTSRRGYASKKRMTRTQNLHTMRALQRSVIVACAFVLLPLGSAPADEMNSTYLVGQSRIDVHVEPGTLGVSNDELMRWVHWASDSVTAYYGRYPVPNLELHIIPTHGRGVRGGKTFGKKEGGLIRIHVGSETKMAGLESDWMLTHEMVHLAFPSMVDEHHWIEEGISTYVEPIARVRAGHMDAQRMWFEMMRDMHQGLPEPGDQGLDHTYTWARTYWGGALFCFLADVEIHKRTNNRKGLEDALRAILNAGGDIRHDWPVTEALRTGDQATGVYVLIPLYEKMKDQPYSVDLEAMWKDLGVERVGETVRFNDSAPSAKLRDAITRGTQPASSFVRPGEAPVFVGWRSR